MAAETAAQRRERLIEVARQIIASEGIAACTFRRLAAVAGTSTRPFTHAFGTRDALLREVALATWSGSALDVSAEPAPIERPADWDAIAELAEIGATWLPLDDATTREERIYLEIVLYSMTRPTLHRELLGYSTGANRQIAAIIAEAQRRGQIRDDESAHELAMAYWSYHAGLALVNLYEPGELPRVDLTRVWATGLRALLVASRPGADGCGGPAGAAVATPAGGVR